jgi:CBS domain-containing protein
MTQQGRARTVGDRMALEPIVISGDASLTEAAQLLDRNHINGVPVVNGAGSLIGVLSQTDLARARSTEYLWANWPSLAVRHLMTSPAVTARRSMPLAQAARKMERHRIHRLVVVADEDETLPIGVLSMTDLVHAIAEEHDASAAPAPEATEGPEATKGTEATKGPEATEGPEVTETPGTAANG